jgi:hypothetical protein
MMNVKKQILKIDDLMLELAEMLKIEGLCNDELDGLMTAIHELREAKLSLKTVNSY